MTAFIDDRRWRAALVLAGLSALSGVLLVGVSAWFLGAVALAGLGPAAYAFSFHHPAAIVRLLALLRTGTKYGERIAGHAAALRDQTRHRGRLFRRMAGAEESRAAGWQLARADRLQSFLDEVEAVDFARLRVVMPVLAITGAGLLVAVLTAFTVPLALPTILGQGALLLFAAERLCAEADIRARKAEAGRREAGERLGQQLSGLVSLEGGGERTLRLGETARISRAAESAAAAGRARLGAADALLSALGPLAAALVLVLSQIGGMRGEALLPAVLAAFSWLALGELIAPLARASFARRSARRAGEALSVWVDDDEEVSPAGPAEIAVSGLPLRDPQGHALGSSVTFAARPGHPVALLGPSGCGKTTLLKRLAGWLPWQEGPHPLGSAANARAASHLSLHDAAVLDATVRDNLFSAASGEELWRALEAAELAERIREAGGLDARITQDMLSLGEARRLVLARACLSAAPLILLDEPGEHLRIDQAERILRRLLERLSDRTILLVTHERRLAALAATTVHTATTRGERER
ncbi:ATP-binding cassette domain-containing protein [Parvularcula oceani]|uniref:ATP-binding cassette domain-containing protein n=1 Tax=Parvularcula oceani TaxID=1247963 RepID=UPI0009DD5BD7|nr:ATP-binding cassette domain-containing protein [Parvularcula oceani]